jgi:hypothetical protein
MNSQGVATYKSLAALGSAEDALLTPVVATDTASANADCDNGVRVHGSARFRRSYDLADRQ